MSASHAPFLESSPLQSAPRAYLTEDVCPTCEQPIPRDRSEEIKQRIDAHQREQSTAITSRLQAQFAQERGEILAQAKQEADAALEQERQLSNQKLVLARDEARRSAEAAAQEKIAEAERFGQATLSALQARIDEAEARGIQLHAQLEAVERDSASAIEKVKQEALTKEASIRAEAQQSAEAAAMEKIVEMELARVEAETKIAAIEEQLRSLTDSHRAQLAQRLTEQREAMEQAQVEAVNAEKSAAFEEKMKLAVKVDELQRALDKKTAEQLGEGAEIDLFEALKAEFEGDRIERINKGQPGADILHTVIHNGKECGKIIYDSKNHNSWRYDFVTKLSTDQMAAKAEHAILSTHKFPGGTRQLYVQDGVVLANPARVVALVTIVRQHLVQTHTLCLSNGARMQKTAALYKFITSERYSDLLTRIDTHAEDLLDIQVKEKKSHEATWKRQGELVRSVQKVRAELCHEIDTIIGTADATEANQ